MGESIVPWKMCHPFFCCSPRKSRFFFGDEILCPSRKQWKGRKWRDETKRFSWGIPNGRWIPPPTVCEADAHHIKTMGKRLGLMSGKVWLQANHDLNEHNPTMGHNWQAKFVCFCQARLDLPKKCKHLQRWAQECPLPGPLRWMPAWEKGDCFRKNGGSLQISTWCYGGPRYNPTLHWNIVPTKSQLHIPTLHSNRIPSLPKAVYQNQLVKCLGTQNYILQGNAGPSTSFPKSRHNSTANKGPSKFRRTAALMLSRTVEKAKACSVVAWSKSNLAGNFSWNFGIQRVPTNLKKRSVWKKYTFIGRYEI